MSPETRRVAARGRRVGAGAEPALLVALVWACSRVLLVIVLLLVALDGRKVAEALKGWDAAIYTRLAAEGYTKPNDHAFFPGLPLLLRAGAKVGIDPAIGGALLAVVCSGLAAWALFRLGSRGFGWGRSHQPVAGAIAACLWLLAPTTVFTAVAYTEAPFCAAAFWAWERARSRHWAEAAVLAGIACGVRVSGVFLVLALLVLALVGNGDDDTLGRPMGERVRDAAWLLVPVAVVAAYVVYLHGQTGSWSAWYEAQKQGWNRTPTHPWTALKHTWHAAHPSTWPGRALVAPVFLAEIVSMAVGVVVTIVCLVRRRWAEAVWVGVQLAAFGTSYWYMSVNRAVLLWFPLFCLLGAVLGSPWGGGPRSARTAAAAATGVVATLFGVAALAWAWLLFTGQWAA